MSARDLDDAMLGMMVAGADPKWDSLPKLDKIFKCHRCGLLQLENLIGTHWIYNGCVRYLNDMELLFDIGRGVVGVGAGVLAIHFARESWRGLLGYRWGTDEYEMRFNCHPMYGGR